MLYHRIAREISDPWSLCVTPEHFVEHLEVLRRFQCVPLRSVDAGGIGLGSEPRVAVTFDDGYSDNVRTAAPLLRHYGIPATFFIASGYLDDPGEYWWDEVARLVFGSAELPPALTCADETRTEIHARLYAELRPLANAGRRRKLDWLAEGCAGTPPPSISRRPMTTADVVRLAAEPIFEVGAHTVTHPLLAALPPEEQRREIQASKYALESATGRPVTSFSYPYGGAGHYAPETVDAVRDCGFERACTTAGRPVHRRDGPFQISRRNVTAIGGPAFEQLLLTEV